jgi:hypothetical protein
MISVSGVDISIDDLEEDLHGARDSWRTRLTCSLDEDTENVTPNTKTA